ncbi:alpha/beta hydrolase family protein [Nesterenkonia aurantiaca]|uniref:alpha/beta hydrolase family protein n=1 Tax=Nesterenkonia aurantiaca TaxID=1436010 RepID=UPI003EE63344
MVADIWDPSGQPLGTAVLLHGGFWKAHVDRRHASHMAHALAADGWKVISVEYPRVPGQPDQTHDAVEHALSELMNHHIADAPSVLVGHSAGGQLALCATSHQEFGFTAQVALAPVTSLRRAEELHLGEGAVQSFLGGPASSRPDLDPSLCAPPTVPTIIVHGEQDQRVPISMSEQYVHSRYEISLTKIPLAGHLDLIDPQSTHWPVVQDVIRRAGTPDTRSLDNVT